MAIACALPASSSFRYASYSAREPKVRSPVSSRYRPETKTRGPKAERMPTSPGTLTRVPMMWNRDSPMESESPTSAPSAASSEGSTMAFRPRWSSAHAVAGAVTMPP